MFFADNDQLSQDPQEIKQFCYFSHYNNKNDKNSACKNEILF